MMEISNEVVMLSRWQFALTAMYHFLFVPLTLGLSVLLGIMETVYVMTQKPIWREMTKFWGVLFGINFAMGVATGITMEFQFGTNWAYYSQYVGDVFGAPLAIEGLMAFFLEATFVGLFFFGWQRLSQLQHLMVTWLVAIGSSFSALWILVANGWMQHPVGAHFNAQTMRMEVTSFFELLFNPVAQAKFVHTISAGYVTGAVFVLAISAFYLLRGRHVALATRSMTVALSFGLASALSVVVLGDESGYLTSSNQKMKLAAMEGIWRTESTPAPFTVFGWPDNQTQTTKYEIQVPWLLGLIATRSLNTPIPGMLDLVDAAKPKITDGIKAYAALQRLQQNPSDQQALKIINEHQKNLGYALLLKRHISDPSQASKLDIDRAAYDLIPGQVATIFWSFHLMAALGFYFIALFIVGFYLSAKRKLQQRWFLWIAFLSLPLPWVSAELGWFVAEHGRQPWVVDGVLPTFMASSTVSVSSVWISLAVFVLFYTGLAVVELYLMIRTIRQGPDTRSTT